MRSCQEYAFRRSAVSVWFALLLGLVQGLTEFLPVSSSAHLCLLQCLFPTLAGQGSLTFDVLLHLATLAAVCAAYWADVRGILLELGRLCAAPFLSRDKRPGPDRDALKLLGLLFLGALPLGLAVLGEERVEVLCGSVTFIGLALLCTGCLLFLSARLPRGRKDLRHAGPPDALAVGLAQALAVLPGLSRSGCTVTVGLARGLRPELAVKYSFLLSIPAVLGAGLLKLGEAARAGIDLRSLPACLLGMLAAGLSGYLSIRLVRGLARRGRFSGFCYYCWGLGLLCLMISIFLKG